MLRLATDADVHGDLIRGVRRQSPEVDLVRVVDALPLGTHDRAVLEWAASEQRILITNDRKTMIGFVRDRLEAGLPMPGVIMASRNQSIGSAIEDILVIVHVLTEDDVRDQVFFLPISTTT